MNPENMKEKIKNDEILFTTNSLDGSALFISDEYDIPKNMGDWVISEYKIEDNEVAEIHKAYLRNIVSYYGNLKDTCAYCESSYLEGLHYNIEFLMYTTHPQVHTGLSLSPFSNWFIICDYCLGEWLPGLYIEELRTEFDILYS